MPRFPVPGVCLSRDRSDVSQAGGLVHAELRPLLRPVKSSNLYAGVRALPSSRPRSRHGTNKKELASSSLNCSSNLAFPVESFWDDILKSCRSLMNGAFGNPSLV